MTRILEAVEVPTYSPMSASSSSPPLVAVTSNTDSLAGAEYDQAKTLASDMGVEHVVLWADADKAGYDYFASRRELFENAGLSIYGFGNLGLHCQEAFVLNLPGRAEKIEAFKQHLRDLGRAGIPYTGYAHMANGVWHTGQAPTRGRILGVARHIGRQLHLLLEALVLGQEQLL